MGGGGIGGENIRCARERDRVLVCKKERYVHWNEHPEKWKFYHLG